MIDHHGSPLFSNLEHKYPYDWRTKKPTIFRATEQWFASVEGFREAAMDAIGRVKWVPPQVFHLKFPYQIILFICIFARLEMCYSSFFVMPFADICELLREKTESQQ